MGISPKARQLRRRKSRSRGWSSAAPRRSPSRHGQALSPGPTSTRPVPESRGRATDWWGRDGRIIIRISPAVRSRPPSPGRNAPRADDDGDQRKGRSRQLRSRRSRSRRCSGRASRRPAPSRETSHPPSQPRPRFRSRRVTVVKWNRGGGGLADRQGLHRGPGASRAGAGGRSRRCSVAGELAGGAPRSQGVAAVQRTGSARQLRSRRRSRRCSRAAIRRAATTAAKPSHPRPHPRPWSQGGAGVRRKGGGGGDHQHDRPRGSGAGGGLGDVPGGRSDEGEHLVHLHLETSDSKGWTKAESVGKACPRSNVPAGRANRRIDGRGCVSQRQTSRMRHLGFNLQRNRVLGPT